jgi:hypothetical protein
LFKINHRATITIIQIRSFIHLAFHNGKELYLNIYIHASFFKMRYFPVILSPTSNPVSARTIIISFHPLF